MDRVPYRATSAAAAYDGILRLPVAVLLDNVRSLYNVGSFFRTGDAAGIEHLHLCGITGYPPKNAISKTALGAEETLPWTHHRSAIECVRSIESTHEIVAIETSPRSVDLYEWQPRFPVCIMFGHEVDGLQPELQDAAHTHVRIPMLGRKHSLNVATAGGVVIFELLRKFHALQRMGK